MDRTRLHNWGRKEKSRKSSVTKGM